MHARLSLALCAAVLLAGCAGGHANFPALEALQVPAEYNSDTVVVPPDLADKFAAIVNGKSGIDWYADPRTIPLDWRRARQYWTWTVGPDPENDLVFQLDPRDLTLLTMSTSRAHGDFVASELTPLMGYKIDRRYFTVNDERAHYHMFYQGQSITLGEAAWLADWALRSFPDDVAEVDPDYYYGGIHSEGAGGDI